jgi:hypothetical protein
VGTIWVLDTETKGTGANMVPLDKVVRRPGERRDREPAFVAPKRKPRPAEPAPPRRPPRFKVVDVMTARTLAEDADARATIDALRDARSVVDVRVSRWDHENERWRLLTLGQQRVLWERRESV